MKNKIFYWNKIRRAWYDYDIILPNFQIFQRENLKKLVHKKKKKNLCHTLKYNIKPTKFVNAFFRKTDIFFP